MKKSDKKHIFGGEMFMSIDSYLPDEDDIEAKYSLIYENVDYENIEIESAPDDDFILETDNKVYDEPYYELKDDIINDKTDEMPKQKAKINYHKDHRQRVRNKFLNYGLEVFSDHEVLEMLLFYSISRKDTNAIAHRLIDKFGTLEGVLKADYSDLIDVEGISDVSASLIMFNRELNQYVRTNSIKKKTDLSTAIKMGRFCANYFREHTEENFIVLSLDGHRKLLCVDVISKGSETETAYYPRKILKAVIKNKTSNIVVSHNHPGGSVEPSSNDVAITEKLSELMKDVGINVIDHIICSGDRFTSMFNRGYLRNWYDKRWF